MITGKLNKMVLLTFVLLGLGIALPVTAARADWGNVQVSRDDKGWLEVALENSKILVRYKYFKADHGEHAIKDFIIKSVNENQAETFIDACANRGPLTNAVIVEDGIKVKTVRLMWDNGEMVSDVSIFPDSYFIKINYIEYGVNIVDIGSPGGSTGVYSISGGGQWKRGHVIYPEIYFDRFPGDIGWQGITERDESGPLNYHGWFITGVYNNSNGRGFGRVMQIAQTDIIKLLWNRGFEFFPCFNRKSESYTGYLFAVNGGGADEILSMGKRLVDGLEDSEGNWKFEEGNGTVVVDSSGNSNDGTVEGAIRTSGKIGGGLNFIKENASVSLPVINSDELSLSAWFFKANNETTKADTIFNAYKWNPDARLREGFKLRYSGWKPDNLEFVLVTEDRTGYRTEKIAQHDLGSSEAEWRHAVCTYDKTTGEQNLYVNGKIVNTQTHPAGNTIVPLTSLPDMKIGRSRGNQGSFNGIIDEVRLYNQSRNDQLIEYSYASGAGMKGYWRFEEGEGKTVTDSSGNGNYGRISGSKWTSGKTGGGMSFNGTDNYVSIPNINSEGASVAAWFYKDASDTTYSDALFSGYKWDLDPQLLEGMELRFQNVNPDSLQFVLVTENGRGEKTEKTAQADLGDSVGKWFHAVGTYNKITGKQNLYINGQLAETQDHSPGNTIVPLRSYPDMSIGYSRAYNGYFNGILDDVLLYERELSFQEVLDLYNGA